MHIHTLKVKTLWKSIHREILLLPLLPVSVRVPTGNKWHTQIRTVLGRFIYKGTNYKGVGGL